MTKVKKGERATQDLVERFIQTDLLHAGVIPKGQAEAEFRLRVTAYGIMNVQPPRPELDEEKEVTPGS